MNLIETGVKDVVAHQSVKIMMPSNIYACELEKEVFVGPFVEIQKGVRIGERTKIQSHSFICELVKIGQDCFIGHGVVFINDTFAKGAPADGDQSLWKNTVVGDHVSIGSNATILPVSICDHVVIGAGAVVTKNIENAGIYAGNPARKIRDFKKK
ncbi:MAG: acyltransferase [Bacteroidota bacterium]